MAVTGNGLGAGLPGLRADSKGVGKRSNSGASVPAASGGAAPGSRFGVSPIENKGNFSSVYTCSLCKHSETCMPHCKEEKRCVLYVPVGCVKGYENDLN